MRLKVISWNVNGLRSFKQSMKTFLDDLQAEIICIQETKITRDMLTEDLALVDGYTSYFAFSRRRSGYSGVATFVKTCCTPVFSTEGLCGVLSNSSSSSSILPTTESASNIDSSNSGGDHSLLSQSSNSAGCSGVPVSMDTMAAKDCNDSATQPLLLQRVLAAATVELDCCGSGTDDSGEELWTRQQLRELDSEGRAVITVHCIKKPTAPTVRIPSSSFQTPSQLDTVSSKTSNNCSSSSPLSSQPPLHQSSPQASQESLPQATQQSSSQQSSQQSSLQQSSKPSSSQQSSSPSIPLAIINVYCPRADPSRSDRCQYKLQFYRALRRRAALLHAAGARVLVLGDVNTSHTLLDHCDPQEDFHLNPGRKFLDEFLLPLRATRAEDGSISAATFCNQQQEKEPQKKGRKQKQQLTKKDKLEASDVPKGISGQEPLLTFEDSEEIKDSTSNVHITASKDHTNELNITNEENVDDIATVTDSATKVNVANLDKFQMVDTFRFLYPDAKDAFSCWNTKANARETNYGTRIDYILCDTLFLGSVCNALVLQDVYGSDHCPVAVVAELAAVPALAPPANCTKNYPEFQGQQQKLSSYFQKTSSGDLKRRREEERVGASQADFVVGNEDGKRSKCSNNGPLMKYVTKMNLETGNNYNRDNSSYCDGSDTKSTKISNDSSGVENYSTNCWRKLPKNSTKSSKTRHQSNLLAFFGGKKKVGSRDASLMKDDRPQTQPSPGSTEEDSTSKGLSLYEAEMLFLKRNPDIYTRLGMAADTSVVNMDALCEVSSLRSTVSTTDSNVDFSCNDVIQDLDDSQERLGLGLLTTGGSLMSERTNSASPGSSTRESVTATQGKSGSSSLGNGVDSTSRAMACAGSEVGGTHESSETKYCENNSNSKIRLTSTTISNSPTNASEINTLDGTSAPSTRTVSTTVKTALNAPTATPSTETTNSTTSTSNASSPTTSSNASTTNTSSSAAVASSGWSFMSRKAEAPLCSGHQEPCVLRTTKKKGPNYNKRFYACNRGAGRPGQRDAQCGYFKWL